MTLQAALADGAQILGHPDQMDQPPDAGQGKVSVRDEVPPEVDSAVDRDSELLPQDWRAELGQPASRVVPTKLAQPALPERE